LSQSWFYLLQDSYKDNKTKEEGTILPENVEKEYFKLHSKNVNYVKRFENATAICIKFEDFTKNALENNCDPDLMVSTLNSVYEKIDIILKLFGVEKIKTSGEEYICACFDDSKDNSKNSCEFALSVVDAINSFNKHEAENVEVNMLLPLNIKIGIHTGNFISTVIESSVITYDLIGVHVKQAFHLQRNCPINSIHVSERTYSNLKDLVDTFQFKEHEFFLNKSMKIKSYILNKSQ
jgi:adenylate cyclase